MAEMCDFPKRPLIVMNFAYILAINYAEIPCNADNRNNIFVKNSSYTSLVSRYWSYNEPIFASVNSIDR